LVKQRVGERGGIGDEQMAGAGAAASALSSPWRALLQRALDANGHLRHSTFFQLVRFDRALCLPLDWGKRGLLTTVDSFQATVGAGGRPANRTVVFRYPGARGSAFVISI
jgi:hypothetical protein